MAIEYDPHALSDISDFSDEEPARPPPPLKQPVKAPPPKPAAQGGAVKGAGFISPEMFKQLLAQGGNQAMAVSNFARQPGTVVTGAMLARKKTNGAKAGGDDEDLNLSSDEEEARPMPRQNTQPLAKPAAAAQPAGAAAASAAGAAGAASGAKGAAAHKSPPKKANDSDGDDDSDDSDDDDNDWDAPPARAAAPPAKPAAPSQSSGAASVGAASAHAHPQGPARGPSSGNVHARGGQPPAAAPAKPASSSSSSSSSAAVSMTAEEQMRALRARMNEDKKNRQGKK